MAISDKTEAVMELANRAWEDFEFPAAVGVAEADGWEYELPLTGSAPITRVFYVESETPETDSIKCQFTVVVDADAMTLKDVYATDPQGNDFGSPGPAASPKP